MEILTVEAPASCATLLRRWREAAGRAHRAECALLRNALANHTQGVPLDAGLKALAGELRRAAEAHRLEALHDAHFPAPAR